MDLCLGSSFESQSGFLWESLGHPEVDTGGTGADLSQERQCCLAEVKDRPERTEMRTDKLVIVKDT